MGKTLLKIVGAFVLAGLGVAGFMTWRFMSTSEQRFDERCWALLGGGGNTLVLESEGGPLVVDTKFLFPAGKLKDAIARNSGKPVKMVVNTHFHFDHTGGNPRYVGAEFVAGPSVPERMRDYDADTFGPGKPGEGALPKTVVPGSRSFDFGDEQVEVHHFGRGHTDGDVVVLLRKRGILHLGDLFVNGFFPVVDVKAGASVREWPGALDKALALGATTIIPGHGPVCTPAQVQRLRDFLASVWEAAVAAVKAGRSEEQLLREFDTKRFGLKPIAPGMDGSSSLKAAFAEAKEWVAAGR